MSEERKIKIEGWTLRAARFKPQSAAKVLDYFQKGYEFWVLESSPQRLITINQLEVGSKVHLQYFKNNKWQTTPFKVWSDKDLVVRERSLYDVED